MTTYQIIIIFKLFVNVLPTPCQLITPFFQAISGTVSLHRASPATLMLVCNHSSLKFRKVFKCQRLKTDFKFFYFHSLTYFVLSFVNIDVWWWHFTWEVLRVAVYRIPHTSPWFHFCFLKLQRQPIATECEENIRT